MTGHVISVKSRYRHVRALSRGLAILETLNRLGNARPAELAQLTGIDRTTTYRILATLVDYGVVVASPSSDHYMLTEGVRRLSDGFTERDRTIQIVTPHLGRLFKNVMWPTDFATFEAGAMVIRETTHRFSPYSVHRAMVGQPRPLLTSALGKAALAGASPRARAAMVEIMPRIASDPAASDRSIEERVMQIVAEYDMRGFAWSSGMMDGRTSAIAVAVNTGTHMGASINLLFFRTAMSIETAAERYLGHLQECVAAIEKDLADGTFRDGRPASEDQAIAAKMPMPAIQPGIAR